MTFSKAILISFFDILIQSRKIWIYSLFYPSVLAPDFPVTPYLVVRVLLYSTFRFFSSPSTVHILHLFFHITFILLSFYFFLRVLHCFQCIPSRSLWIFFCNSSSLYSNAIYIDTISTHWWIILFIHSVCAGSVCSVLFFICVLVQVSWLARNSNTSFGLLLESNYLYVTALLPIPSIDYLDSLICSLSLILLSWSSTVIQIYAHLF